MTVEKIPVSVAQARSYSPLTLAFLGDGVYEIFVRERIVLKGSMSVSALHTSAVKMVRASFQARAVEFLNEKNFLSEEEYDIIRRGRNATGNSVPKSSNPAEYRKATGLEALFGYLYLIGNNDRMREIFQMICEMESAEENL